MTAFGDKIKQLYPLLLKEDDKARKISDKEEKTLAREALKLNGPVTMNPYNISGVEREMLNEAFNYEMDQDEDFKKRLDDFISRNTQTAGKKRRKSKKKKRTKRKLK